MKKVEIKDIPGIFKETYLQWVDDKAVKLAASLSFYSILSLVPMLVIIVAVVGFFFGEKTASSSIITQVRDLVGNEGADVFKTLINYSFFTESGMIPTIISGTVLIVGSVGVFIELKESLNIVWGIETKPGKGLKLFFLNRLLTFPIVFAIGFILIISLVVSAILSVLNNFIGESLPVVMPILQLSDFVVSVMGLTLFFAMLFKFLPDVHLRWRYVWHGAFFTSLLFNLGKFLIGFYLGNTYYGNVYGAAGSLVIMLIWIYYSSIIFFFGAEFTYVISAKYSEGEIRTKKDFVRIKKTNQQLEDVFEKNNKKK